MASISIAAVNALDRPAFIERFSGLFEGSFAWIAAQAGAFRPFASREEMDAAFASTIMHAPDADQLALIRAHPDLVGRAALAGTLTRESSGEQRAAGLDPGALTAAEIDAFTRFNAAYQAKFGFPFVICARENKKAAILAGFEHRLTNSRPAEIQTALKEIIRIGHYRLIDLVSAD